MSEKIFRFFLGELDVIRFVCQSPQCKGAVIELPIDKIGMNFQDGRCPLCRSVLIVTEFGKDVNPIADFGKALERLRAMEKLIKVQLPISTPSE